MSVETLQKAVAEGIAEGEQIEDSAEVTTNLPQTTKTVNLVDGKVTKTVTKPKGRKGRPCIHPSSGRITFLRDEVEAALKNGDVFIQKMQRDHALSEERRATLIKDGIVAADVDDIYYTFQGPIDTVLREMEDTLTKWNGTLTAEGSATKGNKKVSWRCDFHKVKTYSNSGHENFVAPVTERQGDTVITKKIEALPDRIYGYVHITVDR